MVSGDDNDAGSAVQWRTRQRPATVALHRTRTVSVLLALQLLVLGRGTSGCHAFAVCRPRSLPAAEDQRSACFLAASSPSSSSVVSSLDDKESDGEESVRYRFMYMTEEEDRLLKEKGDLEESLMRRPTPLKAMKLTGLARSASASVGGGGMGMGGGGFGGGFSGSKKGGKAKKKKNKNKKQPPNEPPNEPPPAETVSPAVRALARAIREDGLVRIDNVLSAQKADDLRDYLIDLRKRAREDVESGAIADSQERFADVLLNQNRCDLKIPLGPKPVHEALLDLLNDESDTAKASESHGSTPTPSLVRSVIEGVFDHYNGNKVYKGSEASLWELNCFMSNSGARRQLVHADCVCLEAVPGLKHTDSNEEGEDAGEPILLTCFVALQDIDPSMGPTVFMPGTHNIRSHNVFFETGRDGASSPSADGASPKNGLLSSRKSVSGAPLPRGSCILFDPRVLHCAGANDCPDPEKTRALFYVTFKNPKVDSPGCPSTSGYGISTAELTMGELVSDLLAMERGGDREARRVPQLASSP
ncbi:unnamed protein product [Pseudo-nitzschia multistriata]|uniref:Phytanoyl-CoA dioxygenase n=1 Tax=Pseudo-nitzschia multistriata TaxID=183589 RepID=A0A448ZAF2_9STRA|nr:unnamed protein product [Pseudo-nitzschia multistriata]